MSRDIRGRKSASVSPGKGDALSGFKVVELNDVSMTLVDADTGESAKVGFVK